MGQSSQYICPNCGYSAVVAGGFQVGMLIGVDTFVCTDCKIQDDIPVWLAEYSVKNRAFQRINPEALRCEACGGSHLVHWDSETKPCPFFGTKMGSGEIVTYWD